MRHHKGKEIVEIRHAGKEISTVMKSGRIVWEGVRSCYGSGAWRGDKPWVDNDGWKE